jgi:hypothetical protein
LWKSVLSSECISLLFPFSENLAGYSLPNPAAIWQMIVLIRFLPLLPVRLSCNHFIKRNKC